MTNNKEKEHVIYGATQYDWDHFDLILEIADDLLPVVSNPNAEISDKSGMKTLGKTPSIYNAQGKAVGLKGWTDKVTTERDLVKWARNSDYGICIQTRHVRALDIDVTDANMVDAIVEKIHELSGLSAIPIRKRANSTKVLLAFRLAGEYAKRKIVCPGDAGIIEFLANGQQFIAVGTHPSGVRYEWVDQNGGNDLPFAIPECSIKVFENVWSGLIAEFSADGGNGGSGGSGEYRARQKGLTVVKDDPVLTFITDAGLLGFAGEVVGGGVSIICPWESEHTTGQAGDGSTAWFIAGSNGYAKGHFKCLHGHCDGRTDADFFEAIGYRDACIDEFDIVAADDRGERTIDLPKFKRDKRGMIDATVNNVTLALTCPEFIGMKIGFDQFRDEIMYCNLDDVDLLGCDQWLSFADDDYTKLRGALESRKFKPVGRELIRDVVLMIAKQQPFDSAVVWLESLNWDGVLRVEGFLERYFSAEGTDYTKAVAMYMWTAMAGRVLSPGCKADMVPILVGAQGSGKSSGVAAMAPNHEFFAEISFHEKDEDLARKMRGRLVGEIGELRGLHTKELETIKAFITRTHENWIPKYREFAVQFPRRIVFIGTTNKDEFLADDTGNRRWLPVCVGKTDLNAIKADNLQLWAEARELYKRFGVYYEAAEKMSADVHEHHMIKDIWLDAVENWLDAVDGITGVRNGDKPSLKVLEILDKALMMDIRQLSRRDEMRVGWILKSIGYERRQIRENSKRTWVYVKKSDF